MGRKVTIYRPGDSFPSVSATGTRCSLMCDHCKGHYLRSMEDVSSEGALLEFAIRLWKRGGKGFLLSGGCDPTGKVPFSPTILDQLREVKRTTGLIVNAHAGMVGEEEAMSIARAGVDCFSFDVISDVQVLRDVMHLEGVDVRASLMALASTGVRVVPHILAGIGGRIGKPEHDALDMVREVSPDMAVLIVHMPTRGTPMGSMDLVGRSELLGFARSMRGALGGSELVLGCMRPRGDPGTETGVVREGFDGIVNPSSRTVSMLLAQGYGIAEVDGCCAPFPRNDA